MGQSSCASNACGRSGPGHGRQPGTELGLSCGWPRPKFLGYRPLLLRTRVSRNWNWNLPQGLRRVFRHSTPTLGPWAVPPAPQLPSTHRRLPTEPDQGSCSSTILKQQLMQYSD